VLVDNRLNLPVRSEPLPATPLWDASPRRDVHTDIHARCLVAPAHGAVDADLEDRHFDVRHDSTVCTLDRDQVGHVPLDDGIGRVKFPYHRSMVRVVLRIGRWSRESYFLQTTIISRRSCNLLLLSSLVTC
jgi:hypothetical protein